MTRLNTSDTMPKAPPQDDLARPHRLSACVPPMTAKEVSLLLAWLRSDSRHMHDLAMVELMLFGLVRPGALPGLRVGDYRRDENRQPALTLHDPSSVRIRAVPVEARAAATLDAWLAASGLAGQEEQPLFRPSTGKDILRIIRLHAREAGLSRSFTCHTLRDSGIALMLAQGGSTDDVMRRAGFHHDTPLRKILRRIAPPPASALSGPVSA